MVTILRINLVNTPFYPLTDHKATEVTDETETDMPGRLDCVESVERHMEVLIKIHAEKTNRFESHSFLLVECKV